MSVHDRHDKRVATAKNIIDSVEQNFNQLRDVISRYRKEDISLQIKENMRCDINTFLDRLRWNLKSGLIKIAVCGEFTSGKSFLISGLLKRITAEITPHPTLKHEKIFNYIPLLPSATVPTTGSPLILQPSEDNRTNSFEVVLANAPNQWVLIHEFEDTQVLDGTTSNLLHAYITNLQEYRHFRHKEHLDKLVIKARLKLVSMPLPASIYDLPGLGGIETEEQLEFISSVFQEVMRDADYIIYVSSAEKPLSDNELRMLNYIETAKQMANTPLLFVLTKIDLYQNTYVSVMQANRKYFNSHFDSVGEFVDQGLMPVSPAYEARAWLEENPEDRDSYVTVSGMENLREKLLDRLVIWSGPEHIKSTISELLSKLLLPSYTVLERYRNLVSKPINEINNSLDILSAEYDSLLSFQNQIQEKLDRRINTSLTTAFRSQSKLHTA